MTYIHPLDALGDDTRRKIYERICRAPSSVGELGDTVSVSQPAISQHLKVLRQAGLVQAQKQGQKRIYHLDQAGVRQLRAYLDALWDDALAAFSAEAERIAQDKQGTKDQAKGDQHD
jgi:DNA-binding transcriptional ArsR family regulator